MPKKLINGLIFGAGFAVALIVVLAVSIYFIFPALIVTGVVVPEGPGMVYGPDDVAPTKRFLGTTATYDGKFAHNSDRVLPAGPGRIIGTASVNGEALAGLRLRLALNEDEFSQWAATDTKGQYEINLPYGGYTIQGYELDKAFADKVLAGKISDPQNPYRSYDFKVTESFPGRGPDFKFVDPVILDIPNTKFSANEAVVIGWKPYPGASKYAVQVTEKLNSYALIGDKELFSWSERPVVKTPFINLSEYVVLKPGHYYRVDVFASDDGWPGISNSGNRPFAFDFEVID